MTTKIAKRQQHFLSGRSLTLGKKELREPLGSSLPRAIELLPIALVMINARIDQRPAAKVGWHMVKPCIQSSLANGPA